MIASLQKTLDRIRAARAAQAKVVEEIEAPRRKLAAIEEEERAAAEALAEAEAKRAQLEAELADCVWWLGVWEPMEAKLRSADEVLLALDEGFNKGLTAASHVSPYDIGRVRSGVLQQLEATDLRRAERKRLEAALKGLR